MQAYKPLTEPVEMTRSRLQIEVHNRRCSIPISCFPSESQPRLAKYDQDGSGTLDASEILDAFQTLEEAASNAKQGVISIKAFPESVQAKLKEMDHMGTGTINGQDILQGIEALNREKQKSKQLLNFAVVLIVFSVFLLISIFGMMRMVSEQSKDITLTRYGDMMVKGSDFKVRTASTDLEVVDGTLVDRNARRACVGGVCSSKPLKTALASTEAKLSSDIQDASLSELRSIKVSQAGAFIVLQALAVARYADPSSVHGTVIVVYTHLGAITIDADSLRFDETSSDAFSRAGLTVDHSGRRLLGSVEILGTFNTPPPAPTDTARKTWLQNQLTTFNSALAASRREEKYTDMGVSPFTFFRATDHLYFDDLKTGIIPIPSLWQTTTKISTWVSGDLHTQNVGFFGNKDDTVVFDLNDFDESYVAPFYFDLIRTVAAIHLMRSDVGFSFSLTEAQSLSQDVFLTEYQGYLQNCKGSSVETTMVLSASQLGSGFVYNAANDVAGYGTKIIDKYTALVNGVRKFNFASPDLAVPTAANISEINSGWASYTSSLGSFYTTKGAAYFTKKDYAIRLHSGLGSNGVAKYYVLLEGPSSSSQNDDVLIEIKEAVRPCMMSSVMGGATSNYNSEFGAQHGLKVVKARKALGTKVDEHAGHLLTATKSYGVSRVSPFKKGFDAIDFTSKTDLSDFLKFTAKAAAYAHARADNDYDAYFVPFSAEDGILAAIAAWPSAKSAIQTLGENYAARVRGDFALFQQLRSAGQV